MKAYCREVSNEIGKSPFNIKIRAAGDKEFESTTTLMLPVECARGINDLVSFCFGALIKSIQYADNLSNVGIGYSSGKDGPEFMKRVW